MTEKELEIINQIMIILSRYVCDENNCRHCKNWPCTNFIISKLTEEVRKLKNEKIKHKTKS